MACWGWLAVVCCAQWAAAEQGRMGWIEVSSDNTGFVLAGTGERFVPWGFNYDHDSSEPMRLIEEYWHDQWETVVEDFREMKELGANIVRVHLQFGEFVERPGKGNERNLKQLGKLLELAEEVGVYLDVTGLGSYRRDAAPRWYHELGERERWAAQAFFWEEIARVCKDSPAVMFYDLMNEPLVPGGKSGDGQWMVGMQLAGFHYVQLITLDPAGRKREEIAVEWTREMVRAIRKHDERHLISVGLLPMGAEGPGGHSGFVPRQIAGEVDFLCTHIYPESGKIEESLEVLRQFNVGKPVVVEEMFPLNCTAEELAEFIERSREHAAGWIGFYWGKTPQELRTSGMIGDQMTYAWLRVFEKSNPNR
jgi:endo-1,4-beta-mannosidase